MRIIIEIEGATIASAKVEEPSSSNRLAAVAVVDGIFDAGPPALEAGFTAETAAPEVSVFDAGAASISG